MPLTHIEEVDEIDPLDDVRRERDEVRVPVALTAEQAKLLADIDVAEAALTAAVSAHDSDAILAAQEQLENIRDEALRASSRARSLRKAENAARKAEAEAKQAAHRKKADAVEARLRKHGPEVRFPASRGRVVVVKLAGTHLEPSYATEACRRIAYALTQAAASQIIGSRAAGRITHMPEWARRNSRI